MEGKKKKKDVSGKSPGYEDLLDGFAFEQQKDKPQGDLDGLALAELLGDEEPPSAPEVTEATGTESIPAEDYSDLARQFESFDMSTLAGGEEQDAAEEPAPTEVEEDAFAAPLELGTQEIDDGEAADYASLIGELGAKAEAPERNGGEEEIGIADLMLDEIPDEALSADGDSGGGPDFMGATEASSYLGEEPAAAEMSAGSSPNEFSIIEDSLPAREEDEHVREDAAPVPLEAGPDFENAAPVADEGEFVLEDISPAPDADGVGLYDTPAESGDTITAGVGESVPPMFEPEDTPARAGVGYAEALDDLFGGAKSSGDEEGVQAGAGFEESGGEDSAAQAAAKGGTAPVEELSMESLFGGAAGGDQADAATAEIKAVEEPEPAAAAGETDFLGLSSLGGPAGKSDAKPVKQKTATEVRFEGVEMDFYDQTADVTLAELYLAQGKKKEALERYLNVSKKKGVTDWVAKRLRMLSAQEK